ncbi:hypothetical protein FPL06_09755 [Xanthomonas citri pv. glycines]|nr:hypothetical protein BHE84_24255 [Xanthomonas citri pv. glycines str. 8ra]QDR46026.1 hypothetical protein FPK90_16185 [Xanthomonas citri pv. glycines]QDS08017.1 hypothetical protein FPL00_15080 [Xanthomonas citri pv. glycines]QDS12363.1 hypothetical protein FPL03_15425 [Xanthomonas citri pv. glycines]QDS21008.1 hypothetical protein FPL05_15745 [Xanthomonas citri pv. glycines]
MRDALTACGTRRESIHGGAMAASRPPTVPQSVRTPHYLRALAAKESGIAPTKTYLHRLLRWRVGKDRSKQPAKPLLRIPNPKSRIPNPESRQLKHPAPTPSAPVPATPDAPAA